MRWIIGIVALIGLVAAPAATQEPKRADLLAAFEKQLKQTAEVAGPSIACVVVSRSEHYPKPPADMPGKLGKFDAKEFLKSNPTPERMALAKTLDLSDEKNIPDHHHAGGVAIDSSGLVLTPYHAIEGARRIYVHLPGGGSYADIHAADARSDLAVLKLIHPPKKLTAIKFGEVRTLDREGARATVFTGKLVVLLANPYSSSFKLDQPSAAFGSITNVRHRLARADGKQDSPQEKQESYYKCGTLLEYDIRAHAALTGSALVNLDGELIGLASSAAVVHNREIGPGFAIPADENFRKIVEVLQRGEEVEYGYLGITLPQFSTRVEIDRVTPLGPAETAGLSAGDVIVQINGQPCRNYDDLLLLIGSALAGSKVKMRIARGGKEHEIHVTIAKFLNPQPFIASVRPEPVFGLRVDYGSIRALQIRSPRGDLVGVPPGVCVREVAADSAADKQFKELGDDPKRWLIVKVNGARVADPAEFYKAARGQDQIKLTLIDPTDRAQRERELSLP